MEKVRLADALANLRSELYEANEVSKREGLKLEIEAIDVEFTIEVVKTNETSGRLGFNVVVAQGGTKACHTTSRTNFHSIKLHLKPTIHGERTFVRGSGKAEND